MKLKKIIFILIIVLAFFLRFYWLTKNPPALNIDEVSIGYNAYSILHTGKDEYGKTFPVLFRSYDDYKPPLYIYLVSGSMAIFGPTDFAVRFPAALIGVLSVAMLYFLVKKLFGEKKWKLASLAAFLLAISPWHLQFTRAGFEVGTMVFFTCLGLWLLLKAKQRAIYFFPAAVIFGLELFVYQASRIFVPVLVFVAILAYFPVKKNIKGLTIFFCAFALFFLPIVYLSFTPEGQARMKGSSIFQDVKPHEQNVAYEISDWLKRDRWSAIFFHQGSLEYSRRILTGYFTHLRWDFLFLGTNNSKIDLVPEVGLIYLWELPFIIMGFFYLVRDHKKEALLLSTWILISPAPAALTYDIPSSIRVATMLGAIQIVSAVGIINFLSRYKIKYLLLIPMLYFFVFYLHMSYFHGIKLNSEDWYYSYKELAQKTWELAPKYPRVIVSTRLDQPQGFFLYYTKYDPKTYLTRDGGTLSGTFSETRNHMANISFKPIEWETMQKQEKTLFVGKPGEFPNDIPTIQKFYFLDGKVSAIIVER